ncbi:MAG: glutamine-hydrolyzing carbamoyl-phosphate synthase small subunit [Clostridia bacterium]|nr:glutamine-hydrolyzing carbamoyl-phosphate synthase small subunit [Christensenellaceae bacterium]MBR6239275.1 glutamine-hydrolyzing carbamoyl-phosphate synthase small subunit [Clostridia bacterium]
MRDFAKGPDRKLILEDGLCVLGSSFGSGDDRILEIVFNTSMTGYQEILSDPSYTDQAVVMTYPLIGNYGMADDDYETEHPSIGALIVHEYNDEPSNFRSRETLGKVMERHGIPGISGVDTRMLIRSIRDRGTMKALITDISVPREEGMEILKKHEMRTDAVSRVSTREICVKGQGNEGPHIVMIDCGMKKSLVTSFLIRGCRVTIVPYDLEPAKISALRPDGLFISNGPGDPADVPETVAAVRKLIGSVPMMGVCLGHQIISLAYGARTYKLKFGHRGGNHPVKDIRTGKIEITSQNHSYAVDASSIKNTPLEVTHLNLLDGTVEGVACEKDCVMSVQYHPESAPGPEDSRYLFDRFLAAVDKSRSDLR